MGMSPEEMRKLVESLDWSDLLTGQTPYRALSYRRKEDRRDYPNSMVVGLKHGATLASGMNSGSRVLLQLDRLTLPYSRLRSFDNLPIPFRCVGTDLVSGRQQVFDSGPLGMALRATMSLPAIFSPVRTSSQVVADGGLLDNLPVDVVKSMGADIVIAVHLDTGKVQPKELRSLLDVAERSIDVMIDANELNSMLAADVLLSVDVATYKTLDFEQAEKIVPKGYEAAKAKAAMLQKLSVSDADWGKYRAAVEARRLTRDVTPQFIEVEGASPAESREIQPALAGFLGKPLDSAELERSLTRLTGEERIETAGYSIKQRGNEEGLLVSVTPMDYAPPAMVSATYLNTHGVHQLLSRNINAPYPANPSTSPEPFGGTSPLYEYESDGLFNQSQIISNFKVRGSKLSLSGFYTLSWVSSNTNGPDSFPVDQYNLAQNYGRAPYDVRNRLFIMGSWTMPKGFQLFPFVTANSERPFNITLGQDLNGDSIFNDRPAFATGQSNPANVVATRWGTFDTQPTPGAAIIPPNTGVGFNQFTVNMRISKTFGFGRETSGPGGQRGGGGHGHGHGLGGQGLSSGGGGGMWSMGASTNRRFNVTVSASARNIFNSVNLAAPLGNLSSPWFGQSTSIAGFFGPASAANRRIDLQVRFVF
jgi:predicted acylesterase/phospholipase RssA/uncharacterized membrane protein YgcG